MTNVAIPAPRRILLGDPRRSAPKGGELGETTTIGFDCSCALAPTGQLANAHAPSAQLQDEILLLILRLGRASATCVPRQPQWCNASSKAYDSCGRDRDTIRFVRPRSCEGLPMRSHIVERGLANVGRKAESTARHAGSMAMLIWRVAGAVVRGRVPLREVVAQTFDMGV